ncbi:MAG: hypothetical protein ACR2IV_17670 [Bryobacteraceae bacterium]
MRCQFAALWAIVAACGLSSCSGRVEKRQENTAQQQVKAEDHAAPPEDPSEQAMQTTKLEAFSWYKEGFGSIMMANFTIRNDGDLMVKDLEIECTHSAPSGTEIDSNARTIYEIVPPHTSRRFRNFNMGFIVEQAASSSCEIKKLFAGTPEALKRDVIVKWWQNTRSGKDRLNVRDNNGTLVFDSDVFEESEHRADFGKRFTHVGGVANAKLCDAEFESVRIEHGGVGETLSLGCSQTAKIAR